MTSPNRKDGFKEDSIELGLSNSLYGVVVFSPAFFAKNWTRAELNGLFAREMDGRKVILPIWHQLSRADVLKVLPIMADKVALQSSDGAYRSRSRSWKSFVLNSWRFRAVQTRH
jgi:hypothetical protein